MSQTLQMAAPVELPKKDPGMSLKLPRTDNYRLCFDRLRPHIAYQIEFNRLNKHWVPKEKKDEFETLFWIWLNSIEKKKYPGKISEVFRKKGHKEALDVWHKLRVIKKDLLDEALTKLDKSALEVEAVSGDIAIEVQGENVQKEAAPNLPTQFTPMATIANPPAAEEIMSDNDLQPWAAPKLAIKAVVDGETGGEPSSDSASLAQATATPLPPSRASLYTETVASTAIDMMEEDQVVTQILPKVVVLPENVPLPPETPAVL